MSNNLGDKTVYSSVPFLLFFSFPSLVPPLNPAKGLRRAVTSPRWSWCIQVPAVKYILVHFEIKLHRTVIVGLSRLSLIVVDIKLFIRNSSTSPGNIFSLRPIGYPMAVIGLRSKSGPGLSPGS